MSDDPATPDTAPQDTGAPPLSGGQVWVLSEESPFDDPESSGGCVVGVYATAAAALLDLGMWQIGPEGLAEIRWTPFAPLAYEGQGNGASIWILRQHPIQEEADMRVDIRTYDHHHGLPLIRSSP